MPAISRMWAYCQSMRQSVSASDTGSYAYSFNANKGTWHGIPRGPNENLHS